MIKAQATPGLGFSPYGAGEGSRLGVALRTNGEAAASAPTPLPKRPKGRWFVLFLLCGLCGYLSFMAWDHFFRYQAYGLVTGRPIQVAAPWEGNVRYFHVQEGETVQQGQMLATLDNVELRHRLAQLGDELRTAQATIEAEAAKLKWQAAANLDQGRGALAFYYEALANLLEEQATLDSLQQSLRRADVLAQQKAVAPDYHERLKYTVKGQRDKVTKLKNSVEELKERAEKTQALFQKSGAGTGLALTGEDQLKPHLVRVDNLQAERARIQEKLELGQVKAPVSGIVLKRHRFVGETCKLSEPLVTILEEGSLHVVLYLPQKLSATYQAGQHVDLQLAPYAEPLPCTLERLGHRFEPAPEHLKRHYAAGQHLRRAYLQPRPDTAHWLALRVGSVVKLP